MNRNLEYSFVLVYLSGPLIIHSLAPADPPPPPPPPSVGLELTVIQMMKIYPYVCFILIVLFSWNPVFVAYNWPHYIDNNNLLKIISLPNDRGKENKTLFS